MLKRHTHPKNGFNQGAIKLNDDAHREFDAYGFGFPAWAQSVLDGRMPGPVVERRYWTGMYDDKSPVGAHGGWLSGFPHKHNWEAWGQTLVCTIQAPERGGSLYVVDDRNPADEREYEIPPTEGQAVILPGNVKHGVKMMHGDTPRISLIYAAFSEKS